MIVKHGKHMKIQLGKYMFVTHLIGMFFCFFLLLFIPYDNHLRWHLGYIIVWVTYLSAIISFFLLPMGMRFRKWVKRYLGLHVFGSLMMVIFYIVGRLWDTFFGLASLPLLMIGFTMIPCQEYCKSEHYSIKEIKSGILGFPTVGLYQNNGLIEECLQRYDFVLSVKRMEEYDDLSAIIGYDCDNGSETFRTIIFPIDENKFKEHLVDIKKLAEKSNAEIWNLLD